MHPLIHKIKNTPSLAAKNQHLFVEVEKKMHRKVSKHVLWMKEQLTEWCSDKGYTLKTEFVFSKYRKFRFDFYIEELKTGIEYNGLMSSKSRHTTITGYTGDMDKINHAQSLGFKVLQFTVLNYQDCLKILSQNLQFVRVRKKPPARNG